MDTGTRASSSQPITGKLHLGKTECSLTLQHNKIAWKPTSGTKEKATKTITLQDVIAVKPSVTVTEECNFTVHYFKRRSHFVWKPKRAVFTAESNESCHQWTRDIRSAIEKTGLNRPHRLLVFVNPVSGNGHGKTVWRKTEHFFRIAEVELDTITTTHPQHSAEVLSTYDLDTLDGIVCVGGDGTFQQVTNGLMARLGKDAGIDLNDPDTPPPRCNIRVGLIPAGTAQGLNKNLTLSHDAITAALHIITGREKRIHLLTAYVENKLLSFVCMFLWAGFFADGVSRAEKMRYMGFMRYPAGAMGAAASHKTFKAKVEYKLQEKSCKGNMDNHNHNAIEKEDQNAIWHSSEGKFSAVNFFIFDQSRLYTTEGVDGLLFVSDDIDDPPIYLYQWSDQAGKTGLMKHMMLFAQYKQSCMDFDWIKTTEARECKMTFQDDKKHSPSSYSICLDGEPYSITDPTVHVKMHGNLLPVFGHGMWKLLEERHHDHRNKESATNL